MYKHILAACGGLLFGTGLCAQQSAQSVLYSNIPGDPTNTVPGTAFSWDTDTTVFDWIQTTASGRVLIRGDLDDVDDDFVLLDNAIVVREGQALAGTPDTVGILSSLRRDWAVNDLGEVLAELDTDAVTNDLTITLFDAAGTPSVLAREGDPIPFLAGGVYGSLSGATLTDTGMIGFENFETTTGEVLITGTTAAGPNAVFLSEGDPTPIVGVNYENFDAGDFQMSPSGLTVGVQGDTDAASTDDDFLQINGVLEIVENQPFPGLPANADDVDDFSFDGADNWYAWGDDQSGDHFLIRNGAVVALEGDAVPGTGGTELITDFEGCYGNLLGQYAFLVDTDNGDAFRDQALILDDNGTRRVILREESFIDVNGDGVYDEIGTIEFIESDDFALDLTHALVPVDYDAEVGSNGQALLRIPLGGPLAIFNIVGATNGRVTVPIGMSATVDFNSESSSSAGPVTHAWDLDGDGAIDSTIEDPTFTYTNPGNYTVTLTVDDGLATSTMSVPDIVVLENVIADIDATPSDGLAPLTVTFANSSPLPGTLGTTVAWDFDGDGTTDSTLENPPPFTYTTAGVFTASLTLTNMFGTSTDTQTIEVRAADVDFTAMPTSGASPLTVNFTSNVSSPVPVTLLEWDLDGDGVIDSNAPNPTFVYTAGNYDVSLTVTNANGSTTETKVGFITVLGPTENTLSADFLQYQFNEVRGDFTANTASTTLAPRQAAIFSPDPGGWQVGTGRPTHGPLLEPSAGALSQTLNDGHYLETGWPLDVGPSDNFTIMWQHRLQDLSTGTGLAYLFGGDGGSFRGFTGGIAGTGFWFRGTSAGDIELNVPLAVASEIGIWRHLALVVDNVNGSADWYIDGVVQSTTAFTPGSATDTNTNFRVGRHQTAGDLYADKFDLDDFRFYGSALTQAEVQAAMMAEVPVSSNYGTGCAPGGAGIPTLRGNTAPVLGGPGFDMVVDGFAPGAIVTVFTSGLTSIDPSGAFPSLPFDLGSILPALFGGCELQIGINGGQRALGALPAGTGATSFTFPALPILAGLHVYGQAIGLSAMGAQITPAIDVNLQN